MRTKTPPKFQLVTEYQMDRVPWDYIMMADLEKLTRRKHVASGFSRASGLRVTVWGFQTKRGAINTAKRIRRRFKVVKACAYGPDGALL
jgi:hypothetical protein